MMRRKSKRRFAQENDSDIELSMTPMIDVVFQLLIYFLVTFSTADVLAHLEISRPKSETSRATPKPAMDMIRVAVLPRGYAINGREVTKAELDTLLEKLAQISAKQTVLITCDDKSLHGRLIEVLDTCAKTGLVQVSVMSGQ